LNKSHALRLWTTARTLTLLAGAGFSSLLLVDVPAARAALTYGEGKAPLSYVPASDKWISLGTTQVPAATGPSVGDGLGGLSREREQPRKPHGLQIASLGNELPTKTIGRSLSGGSVRWSASSGCLNATLRRLIGEVSANFGPVTVNSTCRNHRHNAKVGGAPRSRHLTGDAVDFRVHGNLHAVHAFLSRHRAVGGLKLYAGGYFHMDTGPRRTW
jgi:hypothetical protein